MPRPAHSLAALEARNLVAHGHDIAHKLVAGHDGPGVGHVATLHPRVAAAHAAGQHPHEHLPPARLLQLDLLDHEGRVGLLEDRGPVRLGE